MHGARRGPPSHRRSSSPGLTELDEKHTVFGRVSEGFDTLTRINGAYCDDDGRPYQNIRIHHVYILDDPFPDPAGLEVRNAPSHLTPARCSLFVLCMRLVCRQ